MQLKNFTNAALWLGNIAGLALLLAVAPDGMAAEGQYFAIDHTSAQEDFPIHLGQIWVVGDLAADNGLTVAVEVGNVETQGALRRTRVALLDGLVLTDYNNRIDVRMNIEHNCQSGRSSILDYQVVYPYGKASLFTREKAAVARRSGDTQFPEQLSPVAEATVQTAVCGELAPDRATFYSPQNAEERALGTIMANYPPVALERAHRLINENYPIVASALQKVAAGQCDGQRQLRDVLAKRDAYLFKLTRYANDVSARGLHAGASVSFYGADDVMRKEVSAVRLARECVGDTSPLPAQGVRIPEAFMPVAE